MEGPPNKRLKIGSPEYLFDEGVDSFLNFQTINGFPPGQPLESLLSPPQSQQDGGGFQLQSPQSDVVTRNAQLSQLLSADSTTSSGHVTDTVSFSVGQTGGINANSVGNTGYNIRPQHPGMIMNNTGQQFMRGMNPGMIPIRTSQIGSFAPNMNNGNIPNMMQAVNGQHRLNVVGQQLNGTVPLHMQPANMMHGQFVNGIGANSVPNLRQSTPSEMSNGNLSNVCITPPLSAQSTLHSQQQQQQPSQLQHNQLASHLSPSANAQTSDPEKRKLIQQQLVLLLHAHRCQRKQNGAKTCMLPHCQTMKNVLHHMTTCTAGKNCTVPHCSSSRQIIIHWKNCNRQECPVCCPLRNASDRKNMIGHSNLLLPESEAPSQEVMAKAYGALGLSTPVTSQPQPPAQTTLGGQSGVAIMSPPPVFSGPPSVASVNGDISEGLKNLRAPLTPSSISSFNSADSNSLISGRIAQDLSSVISNPAPAKAPKEWHVNIKNDLRNHLVHKLVQAIFPTSDPNALRDKRMHNLVQYARKVEADMFETAESQEAYYHLLAEKIYKIQKELEEKHRRRMDSQGLGGNVQNNLSPIPSIRSQLNGQIIPQPGTIKHLDGLGSDRNTPGMNFEPARLLSPGLASPSSAELSTSQSLSQLPSSTLIRAQQQLTDILQQKQNQLGDLQNASRPNSLPGLVSAVSSQSVASSPAYSSSTPTSVQPGLVTPPMLSEELKLLKAAVKNQMNGNQTVDSKPTNGPIEVSDVKPVIKVEEPDEVVLKSDDSQIPEAKPSEDVKEEVLVKEEIKTEPTEIEDNITTCVKNEDKPAEPIKTEENSVKLECIHTPGKKVWTAEELSHHLLPTWEKMYKLEPEAGPFRQPVDPESLNIADYFDIIKNPMDLSTIRKKLEGGEYSDPWAYINDVWLMLDNAWLYNRKLTKVYKYCSKLAEVFDEEITPVMVSLGYCCGKKYVFDPQALCCTGKQLCTIPRDAVYYSYEDKYVYCEKCFQEFKTEEVEVNEDPTQPPLRLKKDQFGKCKNNIIEQEAFVACLDCGRKMHQICVLHMKEIWPRGFTCENCLKAKGEKRKENKYTAKRLPNTKLGIYLENRVNGFLRKKDCGAGDVSIRVLNTTDKIVEVKPGIRKRFADELPASFPYRSKAMFAFEEIDGVDVCFFGMHVQEYGSDVAPPNTRRVYIAYLDSVHFFQPKEFRTAVYHEILVGYLDYVKSLGYNLAHIWACPPSEGDDYIFHCHPPEQKIPKPKRLQEWYRKMLDKAIVEGVVHEYKDVLKDAMDNNMQSAAEMPYFEGDFWPNVIEESIKELDQEEAEKKLREEAEAAATEADDIDLDSSDMPESANGKKKGQKGSNAKRKNIKNKAAVRRNNKRSGLPNNGSDLNSKLFATMEKHKEVFFVIRLHAPNIILQPIQDPDPLIHCDLMDGRDTFLTLAREKHHEFSSLRRVKYSSMAMLYELHVQNSSFTYTCNSCKVQMETRWHCNVCEDFDLCVSCYAKEKHIHKMDKVDLGLDEEKPSADPREARRASVQRFIQFLEHACQCRDANCRMPSCRKMKNIMAHKNNCKRQQICQMCRQLNQLLLYHARSCKENKCIVPFCLRIKQTLQQRDQQQRIRNENLMRRRMALMHSASSSGVQTPNSNNSNQSSEVPSITPTPFGAGNKPLPVPSKALEAAQQAQMIAQMSSVNKFGPIPPRHPSPMGGRPPNMIDLPMQQIMNSQTSSMMENRWAVGQQVHNQIMDSQQQMAVRMGSLGGPSLIAMNQQSQQPVAPMNQDMHKAIQMFKTSGQEEVTQKFKENPELLATYIRMRHIAEPKHRQQMPPNASGQIQSGFGLMPMNAGQMQSVMPGQMGSQEINVNQRIGPGIVSYQQHMQASMGQVSNHSQQQAMGHSVSVAGVGQEGSMGQSMHMQSFPGQPDSFSSMQQSGMGQFPQQWLRQQQLRQMVPMGGSSQPPPYGMSQQMTRMMVMSPMDHGNSGGNGMQYLQSQQQQQLFMQQQQQQQHAQLRMISSQQGAMLPQQAGIMNTGSMQPSLAQMRSPSFMQSQGQPMVNRPLRMGIGSNQSMTMAAQGGSQMMPQTQSHLGMGMGTGHLAGHSGMGGEQIAVEQQGFGGQQVNMANLRPAGMQQTEMNGFEDLF